MNQFWQCFLSILLNPSFFSSSDDLHYRAVVDDTFDGSTLHNCVHIVQMMELSYGVVSVSRVYLLVSFVWDGGVKVVNSLDFYTPKTTHIDT